MKILPRHIIFKYYILFDGDSLECDVVNGDEFMFTFIHRKTTVIKDPENEVIYSPEFSPYPNHHRKITKGESKLEKKIAWFFKNDKVYFSDNEVGEIVYNY